MLNVAKCPTCGTEFEAKLDKDGKAVSFPWNSQKQHCTKHDMLYVTGGECPACVGEKLVAENTPENQPINHVQNLKNLDAAIAKAQANAR
jgi:hypothetical protein